jgi:hypothetical protein
LKIKLKGRILTHLGDQGRITGGAEHPANGIVTEEDYFERDGGQ